MGFQLVYWDANVFHAMFGAEAGRVDVCLKLEKAAKERSLDIYTSTVTFVECVWLKGIPKLSQSHEATIQKYFMHPFIKTVNCDRLIAEQARQLLWKHSSLKPKDAIHAASALFAGVDILHTYDSDLLKLNGQLGSGLKIQEPTDPAPAPKPSS